MKVVVDNTNVEQFPAGNLRDVGDMLRRIAKDVDEGRHGEVFRAVVVLEPPGSLTVLGVGEDTDTYQLMGILEAAKLRVFADDLVSD